MHIFGGPSVGKSITLRYIFGGAFSPHASLVSSKSLTSERHLFTTILGSFYEKRSASRKKIPPCTYSFEFIAGLRELVKDEETTRNPSFIIIDDCESFVEKFPTLVPIFLRLASFVLPLRVCIVWCGRCVWERFEGLSNGIDPVKIHFKCYSKEDIGNIIMNTEDVSPRFKHILPSFVQMFLDIFYPYCNQITELIRLFRLVFPIYIRPVEEGEGTPGLYVYISYLYLF